MSDNDELYTMNSESLLKLLKMCLDYTYAQIDITMPGNKDYKDGYTEALYDIAAGIGIDEELADYEDEK